MRIIYLLVLSIQGIVCDQGVVSDWAAFTLSNVRHYFTMSSAVHFIVGTVAMVMFWLIMQQENQKLKIEKCLPQNLQILTDSLLIDDHTLLLNNDASIVCYYSDSQLYSHNPNKSVDHYSIKKMMHPKLKRVNSEKYIDTEIDLFLNYY